MTNYTYQRPLSTVRNIGIVLTGKTGSGKSSTGNTILGRTAFTAEPSGQSVTSVSSLATSEYGDRTITVVDTPGIHDNVRPDSVIKQEQARMAFLLREGVHCFIICMNASELRVTKEAKQFMAAVEVKGHADFFDYCMLVYTKSESELEDISLNEYMEKQKENADMKSFLEKIGDRVVAVNNKAKDLLEKTRNQDAIIAMVDTVIEDNRTKKNPIVFANETSTQAKKLHQNVIQVVQEGNCHPSLVNATIEAVIWFSRCGTIAEEDFVKKVIDILCESEQCAREGTDLVFKNNYEVTNTPIVDCEKHIKNIYTETKSHTSVLYKMLPTMYDYRRSYLITAGVATVGVGFMAGIGSMLVVGAALLGFPAAVGLKLVNKMR